MQPIKDLYDHLASGLNAQSTIRGTAIVRTSVTTLRQQNIHNKEMLFQRIERNSRNIGCWANVETALATINSRSCFCHTV